MTTKNNDVLGYVTCEAGGRASVHQTKRGKGRFLYTRCDCCGCDQRNGAAVQTRLYNQTVWLGEKPEAPPNLVTTSNDAVPEPKIEPKVEPKPEPKKEPEPSPEEPNSFGFYSLVAVLGGGFAFLISRVR